MSVRTKRNAEGQLIYYVRVQKNGESVYKSFGTGLRAKNEARDFLKEVKGLPKSSSISDKHPSKATFGEVAEQAKPGVLMQLSNEGDKRTYEFRINELRKRYGGRLISSFKKTDIQDCQAWLKDENYKNKTINDFTRLFSKILDYAVDANLIARNHLRAAKKLPLGDKLAKRKPLSRDEFAALIEFLRDDWFRDAVIAFAHTGMRFSELKGLDWKNIKDAGIEVIAFDEFSPKSYFGNRMVPLTHEVRAIMERNRKHEKKYPFPNASGGRIPYTTMWNRWNDKLEIFNRSQTEFKIKSRIHDLRHSFGVWSVQSGVSLTALQRIMGHHDISETALYAASTVNEALEQFYSRNPFKSSPKQPPYSVTIEDQETFDLVDKILNASRQKRNKIENLLK